MAAPDSSPALSPVHGQEAHVTVRATYYDDGWDIHTIEPGYADADDPAVVSWEPAPQPAEDTEGAAGDAPDLAEKLRVLANGWDTDPRLSHSHRYVSDLRRLLRASAEPAPPPTPRPGDWPVGAVMRDGRKFLWERTADGWHYSSQTVPFDSPLLPWTRYEAGGKP